MLKYIFESCVWRGKQCSAEAIYNSVICSDINLPEFKGKYTWTYNSNMSKEDWSLHHGSLNSDRSKAYY